MGKMMQSRTSGDIHLARLHYAVKRDQQPRGKNECFPLSLDCGSLSASLSLSFALSHPSLPLHPPYAVSEQTGQVINSGATTLNFTCCQGCSDSFYVFRTHWNFNRHGWRLLLAFCFKTPLDQILTMSCLQMPAQLVVNYLMFAALNLFYLPFPTLENKNRFKIRVGLLFCHLLMENAEKTPNPTPHR